MFPTGMLGRYEVQPRTSNKSQAPPQATVPFHCSSTGASDGWRIDINVSPGHAATVAFESDKFPYPLSWFR
jgi:hypothetical protein